MADLPRRNPSLIGGTSSASPQFFLGLVEKVIRASDQQHPADGVLRAELKAQSHLPPELRARVSAAVFAFFRWQGWLDPAKPLSDRIECALSLADRFTREPGSFQNSELLAKAVPDWITTVMNVSPAWARALQSQPKLWLRAPRHQGQALASQLGDCHLFGSGTLSNTIEYRGHQDLFRTPQFHAGEFELQDLSSQAVGLICNPQPGQTWWDACAGEGGKLLHLSDLMENQGLIWASDPATWRLQRLKRRAARAKVFNYRAAPWNGGPKLPTRTKFDGVLVDAPCSGIGTWQRNPHARWTLTPTDVRELGQLQQNILAHAASAVKPGGKLIYAVCTFTTAETVEVSNVFSCQFPEFEQLLLTDPLHHDAPAAAHIEYWPQHHGGIGMFVAAWQRRSP